MITLLTVAVSGALLASAFNQDVQDTLKKGGAANQPLPSVLPELLGQRPAVDPRCKAIEANYLNYAAETGLSPNIDSTYELGTLHHGDWNWRRLSMAQRGRVAEGSPRMPLCQEILELEYGNYPEDGIRVRKIVAPRLSSARSEIVPEFGIERLEGYRSELHFYGFPGFDSLVLNFSGAAFVSGTIGAPSGTSYFEASDGDFSNSTIVLSMFYSTTWASFRRANLTGATIRHGWFGERDLDGSTLSDTNFSFGTVFDGTVWEPMGSLPYIPGIANARGLHTLTFEDNPGPLIQLRKGFRDQGFEQAARDITFALHKRGREIMVEQPLGPETWTTNLEGWLRYVVFELPVQYGRLPGRPLLILVGAIFFFFIPYLVILMRGGKDGIWRTWLEDRKRQDLGRHQPDGPLRLHGLDAIRAAFYFSILSAFHIGWRDLNVGTWITRMQGYEYSYSATGWARRISGAQSLLSVYLLALAVLSYFGQPFG